MKIRTCVMPEGKCLVGFSGGADSTALMMLLAAERDAGRAFPEAVHVNHGLRGDESDCDEAFCTAVCNKLNIPIHTLRLDLNGKSDENTCRKARFDCFKKAMKETGINTLVLAHNLDDVAETFIMRLMRGAGTEGLACMSPQDEHETFIIFRPLLRTGRDEIREALQNEGIPWREDTTNTEDTYLRNRVRNRLIPMMEEMVSGTSVHIARTASILTADNQILQKEADSFLNKYSNGRWLNAKALTKVPDAMKNRILRTWWQKNAFIPEEHALNARQSAELSALCMKDRGKVNLPGGMYAVKCRNGIYLTELQERKETGAIPYNTGIVRLGKITLSTVPAQGDPGDGITSQEVPEAFIHGCVVRTRQKDDRIRPFGMKGSKKLADYFADKGIDEPWRDQIPLLCRGSEVLLAAGVGAGAVPRWSADEVNIRLVWGGELPWISCKGEN